MSTSRPLVTFALFTYNQEAYVAEAVEGALSQDYSPLEIIISDDASTDRTFEIIQGLVRDYRGPHDIRLIRNEANLGIGAHVTKVANLARGELIVAAAGDDISLPGRSSAMALLWERLSGQPDLLCCDIERIDRHGQSLGFDRSLKDRSVTAIKVARDGQCALGATATWSKRLWSTNPGLPADCTIEDQILTLRAAMAGGVASHPKPLVRYRVKSIDRAEILQGNPDPGLRCRVVWNLRMRRSLSVQIDDAVRFGRPDLARQLERRARTRTLVEHLYGQTKWPALSQWRGAFGARASREVMAAIAVTRFRRAHRYWERVRFWIARV